MAKPSPRRADLSREEQLEPQKLIAIRIPKSWYQLLSKGNITDSLLPAIGHQVKQLRPAER